MADALPKTYFSFLQPNLLTVLGWVLGSALSMMVSAPNLGIALGAKTLKDARGGFIIGGTLLIPFAIMTSLIGISAKIAVPQISANTALYGMANHLGNVYGSIISVCIIAVFHCSGYSAGYQYNGDQGLLLFGEKGCHRGTANVYRQTDGCYYRHRRDILRFECQIAVGSDLGRRSNSCCCWGCHTDLHMLEEA